MPSDAIHEHGSIRSCAAGRGASLIIDACPPQRPRRLNRVELAQFHSEDYVEFLEKICPERLEVDLFFFP